MSYYNEGEMKTLREALEKEILAWPEVAKKTMFGCPSYTAGGGLFCFLVAGGLVLTALPEKARAVAEKHLGGAPFQAGPRIVEKWLQVPIASPADMKRTTRYVKQSYAAALGM